MASSVKITVLIPVYNASLYLAQCLDSVLSQTMKDIEVVCVDDASTDGSLLLLREYEKKDARMRVIALEKNSGRSMARNIGLENAVGDYILFVDADDFLEPGTLEMIYTKVLQNNADRVGCSFRYLYENDPDREDFFIHPDDSESSLGYVPCSPETIGRIHHGTGGMVLRRSIIQEHGLRFPDGVECEDLFFHYASFPYCRKACVIVSPCYVYRKHGSSVTAAFASGSSRQSLDYLTVAELVLEEWKRSGILEEYRVAFLKMLVMGVRNIRKYAPHAAQKEVTRKVRRLLCEENLYRLGEDDSRLSRREGKLLKTWLAGKSGLDFSYYWKRMRKAGARMLRR